MARILALEPDPERSVILRRLVKESLDADVVLSASVDDAINDLCAQPADLILLSSLLPPDEEEHLTAYLRLVPDLDHVPVLTVPPLVAQGQENREQVGVFRRLLLRFRRKRQTGPTYDFTAIAMRIEDALQESRRNAHEMDVERPARLLLLEARGPLLLTEGRGEHGQPEALSLLRRELESGSSTGLRELQARAPRLEWHQLPWLNSIRLTWGAELQLVNISRSGLLVESGVRFTMGNRTEFQLIGDEGELIVKARIVRSDVSGMNDHGVKYVAAAAFDRPLRALDTLSFRQERPALRIA